MAEAVSVRAAAQRLGIHKDTAFRWRHRLLAVLDPATDPPPAGIVEVYGLRLPFSAKGRRAAGRHGTAGGEAWLSRPKVYVVVACDRSGAAAAAAATGRPLAVELGERLLPLLNRPCTLVGRAGRFSAYGVASARAGVPYRPARGWTRALRLPAGRAGRASRRATRSRGFLLDSTARAAARAARFRKWLRRFRGVATRYLQNYLCWHLVVDREAAACSGLAAWMTKRLGRRGEIARRRRPVRATRAESRARARRSSASPLRRGRRRTVKSRTRSFLVR